MIGLGSNPLGVLGFSILLQRGKWDVCAMGIETVVKLATYERFWRTFGHSPCYKEGLIVFPRVTRVESVVSSQRTSPTFPPNITPN